MTNLKPNEAVFQTVCEAAYRAVDNAVHWNVRGAVLRPVNRAVRRTVSQAEGWAVWDDPDHPALQDFMRDVGRVR